MALGTLPLPPVLGFSIGTAVVLFVRSLPVGLAHLSIRRGKVKCTVQNTPPVVTCDCARSDALRLGFANAHACQRNAAISTALARAAFELQSPNSIHALLTNAAYM
ncbi:hypothetical protein Z946_2711 [Sulfitobacter noctilucicola]|nr:hypothetical protein Z946_2711 [Sulfitobacter noctilucicola]